MNQQTLMDKLEECKHYDKDNRYFILPFNSPSYH